MKRLKEKQLGPWCGYCPLDKPRNRAIYVGRGFRAMACETHKEDLLVEDRHSLEQDARYTEADNQTWGRL